MRKSRVELNPDYRTNLGRTLRSYRLLGEIEQRALAKCIGIGTSTLCRIELGHKPDGDTLVAIIRWLMSVAP